ncbi:MAG: glycosyltransferase, partial [Nitrospirota bacterium]
LAHRRGDKLLFIALDNSASGYIDESDNLKRCKVKYSDVPMYLASADVCLCLYDGSEFASLKSGFNLSPLKLFDYMASGKPIIGSRLGQIEIVLEDGKEGFLVSSDINDIYDKLMFCFRNRETAAQMGLKARAKVINYYNWDRAGHDTLDLFKSLV